MPRLAPRPEVRAASTAKAAKSSALPSKSAAPAAASSGNGATPVQLGETWKLRFPDGTLRGSYKTAAEAEADAPNWQRNAAAEAATGLEAALQTSIDWLQGKEPTANVEGKADSGDDNAPTSQGIQESHSEGIPVAQKVAPDEQPGASHSTSDIQSEPQTGSNVGIIHATQIETTNLAPDISARTDVAFDLFGHRSGAECHMECDRRWFLNYAYDGPGITPSPGPLYFAVGSAVHIGLANLLAENGCDAAVAASLQYFGDQAAFAALPNDFARTEQRLLVAGLLRSFYLYAWPAFSRQYEILHLEHGVVDPLIVNASTPCQCKHCAGLGKLPALSGSIPCVECNATGTVYPLLRVNMMSRPDFIARVRQTDEIVGGSWKTIDDPSDLRRSYYHNDLQGLMELHYGDALLATQARQGKFSEDQFRQALKPLLAALTEANLSPAETLRRLATVHEEAIAIASQVATTPRQIDYIQTIFLVKGKRVLVSDEQSPDAQQYEEYEYSKDKVFKQASFLCYQWVNSHAEGRVSPRSDDIAKYSWNYRFWRNGNASFNNLGKDWLQRPLESLEEQWDWLTALQAGDIFPSTLQDERNIQAPLSTIVRFEAPLYRNAARAARFVQQQKTRFVGLADKLFSFSELLRNGASVDAMSNYIDDAFPQSLTSCRTPMRCAYLPICEAVATQQEVLFATQGAATGLPEGYEPRKPHHVSEQEFFDRAFFESKEGSR